MVEIVMKIVKADKGTITDDIKMITVAHTIMK